MTDQPTPETDDFRPCHLTPSDWPAFARALEIERNAARAERDAAISLGRHAMFCVHHTDAQREANTVGGNCPICNKAQIRQLRAERDALAKERDAANALTLSLCADRDNDAKDRDDEIAVLRADVARLRTALEGIAEYGKLCNDGDATDCERLIYLAKQALSK